MPPSRSFPAEDCLNHVGRRVLCFRSLETSGFQSSLLTCFRVSGSRKNSSCSLHSKNSRTVHNKSKSELPAKEFRQMTQISQVDSTHRVRLGMEASVVKCRASLDMQVLASRHFWKLRQREVEPYSLQYRPSVVKYGDLTDPVYFDFISFAQFSTISNEMRTGEVVFKEKLGSDGEVQVVRRDERLKDNSKLPIAFSKQVGDTIYRVMLEGFEGEVFNAPQPCPEGSSFSCVVEGVRELLHAFVRQGYALNAVLDMVEPPSANLVGKLRVKIIGSATNWGLQALASRGALVLTNFDALAIGGFLRASKRVASYKIRYSDATVEELWTIAGV